MPFRRDVYVNDLSGNQFSFKVYLQQHTIMPFVYILLSYNGIVKMSYSKSCKQFKIYIFYHVRTNENNNRKKCLKQQNTTPIIKLVELCTLVRILDIREIFFKFSFVASPAHHALSVRKTFFPLMP